MWNVGTFAIGRVVLLVTTIVTARLLSPDDFGLLGLALTVTTFLDVLNDFGLTTAYVYFVRRDEDDHDRIADTTFSLSLVIGVVLTLATLAASPLVADFYDEPRVSAVLAALSVNFLIVSLGSVHDGRMRARLDFKRRFFAELGRSTMKGASTVGLAVAGLGIWSLVLGQIIGTVASTVLYVGLERWVPRLRFDRALAKRMLRYGFQLASVGLFGLVASNLDYVVIGRRLGTEALGVYTIAFRLPSLAIRGTSAMVSQVVFSAYTKVADQRASLVRAMLQSMRMLAYFTVPVAAGMATVAPVAIDVLFGSKWEAAGPVLRVLAAFSLVSVLVYNAGDVYKAVGRPGLLTVIGALNVVLAAPVLWFAAGRGIGAVAWGQLAVALAVLVAQLVVLHRILGVTPLAVLRTVWPPLAAGALLVAAAAGAMTALEGTPAIAQLLGAAASGALVYVGVLRVIDPVGFAMATGFLRPGRGRSGT